jgi:hypothetical protein
MIKLKSLIDPKTVETIMKERGTSRNPKTTVKVIVRDTDGKELCNKEMLCGNSDDELQALETLESAMEKHSK